MKKYICLSIIVLSLFIVYLFIYFLPRNYEIVYTVDNFNIKEKHNKINKYYFYEISDKDNNFEYSFYSKYYVKRKRLTNIKVIDNKDYYCIVPSIMEEKSVPLCIKDKQVMDYYLIDDEEINKYKNNINNYDKEYKKIKINNYYNSTFAIWNYKGLYYLNEKDNMDIKLFIKDVYSDDLSVLVDNVLFIPNYNMQYVFNEIYLVNMIDGTVDTFKIDYEISYDSYILGIKDKVLYLVDKKNKKEYKINIKKKKIEIIGSEEITGKIFKDKWKDISINKLSKEIHTFSKENIYNYELDENKLYLKYKNGHNKILINEKENIKILSTTKSTLLYLINDELYAYSPLYGNKLLMKYFEWNFNYNNKVFIYNQF